MDYDTTGTELLGKALIEAGCTPAPTNNPFGDKYIRPDGQEICAQDLNRLGKERILQVFREIEDGEKTDSEEPQSYRIDDVKDALVAEGFKPNGEASPLTPFQHIALKVYLRDMDPRRFDQPIDAILERALYVAHRITTYDLG
jgi:hypothetical protein